MWKLQFLWWGAILMTVGVAIYFVYCPSEVRQAGDAEVFVRQLFQVPDGDRVKRVREGAVEFMKAHHAHTLENSVFGVMSPNQLYLANERLNRQEGNFTHMTVVPAIVTLFNFEFARLNRLRPLARHLSVSLMSVGAVLFVLPSLDVTWRVLKVLVGQLVSW